jgi:hypothetical protein
MTLTLKMILFFSLVALIKHWLTEKTGQEYRNNSHPLNIQPGALGIHTHTHTHFFQIQWHFKAY